METTRIDAVTRIFARSMSRREALRGLVAGAVAVTTSGTLLQVHVEDASARRRRPRDRYNVCDGKNWCHHREQTCGPAGGYGKCLETANGNHISAEILLPG